MPQGLEIKDGTPPWLSAAIRLHVAVPGNDPFFNLRNDINVAPSNLKGSTPHYFSVTVKNTSTTHFAGGCPAAITGPFVAPLVIGGSTSPGGRFTIRSIGQDYVVTDTANPMMATRTYNNISSGVLVSWAWAPKNEGVFVTWQEPGLPRAYSVLHSTGTVWNEHTFNMTVPAGATFFAGYSPDGLAFIAYITNGSFVELVSTVEGQALTFSKPTANVPGNYYFSPGSDLLAWVPSNADPTEKRIRLFTLFGSERPNPVRLSNIGNEVETTVDGTPVTVAVTGSMASLRVLGSGVARQNMTGIALTNAEVLLTRGTVIDYLCVQRGMVKVEVQIQPTAIFNTNKSMPDAFGYVDLLRTQEKRVQCLSSWTTRPYVMGNPAANHYCVFAEAFTPGNSAVPQISVSPYPVVTSEPNLAQLNIILARASQARAIFTVPNPLDRAAEVIVSLVRGTDIREQFSDFPKAAAQITQVGLRQIEADNDPSEKLIFTLEANSATEIEFLAEVDEASDSPSAAVFSVLQRLEGVPVGGITVVALHGQDTLTFIPEQGSFAPPCPLEMQNSVIITDGAVGSETTPFDNLYAGLSRQVIGAYFVCPNTDLDDVSVYVESAEHPLLNVEGKKIGVGTILSKEVFYASWAVDCSTVPAGKYAISFVAQASGYAPQRIYGEVSVLPGLPWTQPPDWFDLIRRAHHLDRWFEETTE